MNISMLLDTQQCLTNYRQTHEDDAVNVRKCFDHFDKYNHSAFSRNNYQGHFTVSMFVLNKDCTKLITIEHETLQRTLQPGGHIEYNDTTLIHAATRELREEVPCINLNANTVVPFDHLFVAGLNPTDQGFRIFDIDIHVIPLSRKELEHVHFDVRFAFMLDDDSPDIQWTDLNDPKLQGMSTRTLQKLMDLQKTI